MKKILALLFCIALLSCDDGDFDVPALDFDSQNIEFCGDLVFFKINDSESLIIELNTNDTQQEFLLKQRDSNNNTFQLGTSNTISYRIFSEDVSSSYFCQSIPPATPTVTKEWTGTAELILENTITDDDNDGVEETDLLLDTDGDGTFNYLDNDDDGDGILTINELDIDGNPIDTDNDGIDDYLDTDDDDDLILTINESLSDTDNSGTVDYLDSNSAVALSVSRDLITDSYTSSYALIFTLYNLVLIDSNSETITFDVFDYGTLTGSYTITN
ncbi:MAG: hypothetical protein COA67_10435 [Lutibacter sp.]|nr:MAG: hypothetical protein COA67_10435 [Lutibacter sp.]